MTAIPEASALLSYALLQLDPRLTNKREALNALLVDVALFLERAPQSSSQIRDSVSRLTGQTSFLSEEDLDAAILNCQAARTLTLSGGQYELSPTRREALASAFANAEDCRSQVESHLIEAIELEIGALLAPDLSRALPDLFVRAITEGVYLFSIELARGTLSLEAMLSRIENSEPLAELKHFLASAVPSDRPLLHRQILGGIITFLRQLPPELRQLLKLLHYNVLLNQILNLDPIMVGLQKDLFPRRRLYLDTNVVLSLLCEGHPQHKVVQEVIEASLSLGVQLYVSPVTMNELQGQVERAKKDHVASRGSQLMAALAAYSDDAILATFFTTRQRQRSLSWESFIAPFDSLEDVLLDSRILLEPESFEEARNSANLPQIEASIRDAKSPFVSGHVIEHDTLNCALIFALRAAHPADERGNTVWLLTIDRSLQMAQRVLLGGGSVTAPYCIQVADWGEIVLPALSLTSFVFDDFIGYLAQARLGVLMDPAIVQLDFLETIEDAQVDVDRLLRHHPDQVRRALIALQVNNEVRGILKSAASAQDTESRAQYQLQLDQFVQQAIDETDPLRQAQQDLLKKVDILNLKVGERDQKISELSDRLKKIESSLFYRILRRLRGVRGS